MAYTPLNALNGFLAVARRRSFAAAARHLGVSTSALSQSVRQLESRLGVALLTRTSRTVALTDAGQRLLEHSGAAVDQALEALRTVTARPGEITGRVRLSVPAIAVPLILDRLIPRFLERHPRVELDVRAENHFVNIVAEGLDGGIRLAEAIERDMVQVRLTPPGRFVVAGSPSYLARHGTPQRPEDLLQHDCLCIQSTPGAARYAWELERGKRTWRVPVRGPVSTNDGSLMLRMAKAGVGLTYAYEPLIAEDLAAGRLRVLLEPYAASVPGFFLYFPSRAQVSPAFRAFVDVARELAGPAPDLLERGVSALLRRPSDRTPASRRARAGSTSRSRRS
ncbi:MAG TPA: LysR substrate-binding domain-containing protein [Anaeromyxobacteraceae bacterium]|nr:LysR substrate-binding domain-containing protein [Anaeromyxobacteraceae bacterium]